MTTNSIIKRSLDEGNGKAAFVIESGLKKLRKLIEYFIYAFKTLTNSSATASDDCGFCPVISIPSVTT